MSATGRLHRPVTLADAQALLRSGRRFRLVAGGQGVTADLHTPDEPTDRVSLGAITGLRGIAVERDELCIGALATHHDVARSPSVIRHLPALAALAGEVGDWFMRNRGTVGGALFTASSGGCYPAALIGTNASIRTLARDIPAEQFFAAPDGAGALAVGEIVTGVRIPIPLHGTYQCIRPTPGRFVLVGVFASLGCAGARVGITGYVAAAMRAQQAERLFEQQAGQQAAGPADPPSGGGKTSTALSSARALLQVAASPSIQGSVAYKEAMTILLLRRALAALSEGNARSGDALR